MKGGSNQERSMVDEAIVVVVDVAVLIAVVAAAVVAVVVDGGVDSVRKVSLCHCWSSWKQVSNKTIES